MTQTPPQCQNLQNQVGSLLQLLHQEPSLRSRDIRSVEATLGKAISPTFEIVFAGAFSAGKSMLLNALLERELLYSGAGQATGTECYIAYAEPNQEKVRLTFLSEAQIQEQAAVLCQRLGLTQIRSINQPEAVTRQCQDIIQQEGGEIRSELALQALALKLLLEGFEVNRDRIHIRDNHTYSMEQFNFSNLQEAADYIRCG